jgi:hypothetical protein
MIEITRRDKVRKLSKNSIESLYLLARMTDKEINDLHDQHFNQVTKEDFEGFKKVCGKYRVKVFSQNDLDDKIPFLSCPSLR